MEVVYEFENGDRDASLLNVNGQISVDGNNPWVFLHLPVGANTKLLEFRVSWGLLLEVLNDNRAAPILMNQDKPVTIPVKS